MRPGRIYLDYSATAPVRPEVKAAVEPILFGSTDIGGFGNASSVHWAGQEARRHLEKARTEIAQRLARKPSEIIFTSGGTEADNLAVFGSFDDALNRGERCVWILSAVEHPAVDAARPYWARRGVEIHAVGVDGAGHLDLATLDYALARAEGAFTLVSVMAVNNETGIIHDLDAVRLRTQQAGARLHVDAVQAAGRLPPEDWAADLIVLSGHKLGGLAGAGVLALRENLPLASALLGGPQERGKRAGTESVAAAVGLSVALSLAEAEREAEQRRLKSLRDRLDDALLALAGVRVLKEAPRVAAVSTALFDEVDGEVLLQALDLEGIAVSSGSACSSGSLEPSRVLLNMGIDPARASSALRFSLGRDTTTEEIETVTRLMPALLTRARAFS